MGGKKSFAKLALCKDFKLRISILPCAILVQNISLEGFSGALFNISRARVQN